MTRFRIALVAHGRFHMFDLGRELLRLGHDVVLFTNYSPATAEQFGIPADRVRCYRGHRLLTAGVSRVVPAGWGGRIERWGNTRFGHWATRVVGRESPVFDVVGAMSGIAEPLFQRLQETATLRVLHRGSAHIRVQRRILEAEEWAVGLPIDRPSDWIVDREEREYRLADRIVVLSPFARDSFREMAVPEEKVGVIQPGVQVDRFRASPELVAARCDRIRSGGRLRVLCVGTFCLRKGAAVWEDALRLPGADRFDVRFVGAVAADSAAIHRRLQRHAEFRPRVPHHDLPLEYQWGDVFAFPTLEEGFPAVINQAQAAALPIVSTPVCRRSRDDWHARCGWQVPARDPVSLMERLLQLDADRPGVEAAVRSAAATGGGLDWSETAREYQDLLGKWLPGGHVRVTGPDADNSCQK